MRVFVSAVIVTLCLNLMPIVGHASPEISANNAIVIEQESGRTLFEQKAHDKQPIASITKLMTAIIAVESGQMNEKATTSSRAVHTEGSSLYLKQGEKMKVEDIVYGMMLRSGNDAAVTLSEHIGGSVEGFVHLMNEKAAWLGMDDTHFENPHGLHSENHYSTAYDMALLMQYAMGNKQFQTISKTKMYQADSRAYAWKNKNRLLTSLYPYSTGGKTGYTQNAGRTLVTTARKNGMDLIAVTLNAPDDWNDHINMFEWAFKRFDMKELNQKDNNKPQNSQNELIYPLTSTEQEEITRQTVRIESNDTDPDIIKKTFYYLDDQLIGTSNTKDKPDNHQTNASLFSSIQNSFKAVLRFDMYD